MTDAKAAHRRACGQLVIGGFEGTELTPSYARARERGERGGAIHFTRNLTRDPMQCAALARARSGRPRQVTSPSSLVSIDQEGAASRG